MTASPDLYVSPDPAPQGLQAVQQGLNSAPRVLTTAGAADPMKGALTQLNATGGSSNAFTLANGIEGQEHTLYLNTKGGAGNAVVTPATFDGTHTTITLTAVGQAAKLKWLAGGWRVLSNIGTTLA